MNSDLTRFERFNVIDSCSIWNILSSSVIYNASLEAGCFYSFTNFVKYECLYKRGKQDRDGELLDKLSKEIKNEKFKVCAITIDDLQEIDILENRKRLGKGELSSIVFAKKTNQAFLTDDKKARSLAISILGKSKVQTTPHLVGFCFYKRHLLDGDFASVVSQHLASLKGTWGDLSIYFKDVYEESLRIKLLEKKNV